MSSTQQTMQLAMNLHERGQLEQAEQLYRRVLVDQPAHFGASHLFGLVLLQRGQAQLAEQQLLRALQINAQVAEVHAHHGNALLALDRCTDALHSYERALVLQPLNPQFHFSRGNVLVELTRFGEALAAFDQAIALDPEFANAYRNRGVLKLLLGKFAEGLSDYEHRRPRDPARRMLPALLAPDWAGEDLDGRSIIVSDATGLGDVIQFCRYLPVLADRGARVSFLGSGKLIRLLQSLDSRIEWLRQHDPARQFDFQCKLLSLPFLCRTRLDSIPSMAPYLHAEPELARRWKQRMGSDGFKVGVCWRGNPGHSIDAGRAVPLAGFEPMSRIPGVRLISLQKKFGLEELAGLPAHMRVETLGDDFDEGGDAFVDSAAVIANLDLVICSCTSIAHLAGALGVPTWVALKQVPEWRWLLDRQDSPWYPSQTLFRQTRRGEWGDVFIAMTRALANRVAA